MKKFWRGMMEWKTAASLLYTGAMFFYMFFCWVFDTGTVSTKMLWTLLLVCVVGALFQGLCFSDWVIRKLRYTWRSLLFVALFLPTLSIAAWKAEWFPVEELGAWATFLGLFFLTFLVMTVGFDIYFRITGRKYDGLLGQYRREKEEE